MNWQDRYATVERADVAPTKIPFWRPPPVQNVRSVETVEVQKVVFLRGLGVAGSVCREVTQYWKDGELLAEVDPE